MRKERHGACQRGEQREVERGKKLTLFFSFSFSFSLSFSPRAGSTPRQRQPRRLLLLQPW